VDPARLERAQTLIRYRFRDPKLLATALTHPSYAAEAPGELATYERLEFLGDAVLGFVVAERLYRFMPDAPEGELTQRKIHAVAGTALAGAAHSLGLDDVVFLGKGVSAAERGRASILENVFEAIVGAIYLDGGLAAAGDFAVRALGERFVASEADVIDPKSALQQLTQGTGRGLPHYRVVATSGPPHLREFTVEVLIDGAVAGLGIGPSKQAAEKSAAADALEQFEGGAPG
jgi:ribonuclease-3